MSASALDGESGPMREHRKEAATPKRILGVFAHPDDETSGCGGTFARYAAQGAEVWVATATRGEWGTLGTGGLAIRREDLPRVRAREQRAVARLLGVRRVVYLGYRDGEVKEAPHQRVVSKVLAVMGKVRPDAVITFGPQGISRHEDHIAISRAATEAFHRYLRRPGGQPVVGGPALYYVALPKEAVAQFQMQLDGVETQPSTVIDIAPQKSLKVQALRLYQSQEDAQQLADVFDRLPVARYEYFHQAYPPALDGTVKHGLWD